MEAIAVAALVAAIIWPAYLLIEAGPAGVTVLFVVPFILFGIYLRKVYTDARR